MTCIEAAHASSAQIVLSSQIDGNMLQLTTLICASDLGKAMKRSEIVVRFRNSRNLNRRIHRLSLYRSEILSPRVSYHSSNLIAKSPA